MHSHEDRSVVTLSFPSRPSPSPPSQRKSTPQPPLPPPPPLQSSSQLTTNDTTEDTLDNHRQRIQITSRIFPRVHSSEIMGASSNELTIEPRIRPQFGGRSFDETGKKGESQNHIKLKSMKRTKNTEKVEFGEPTVFGNPGQNNNPIRSTDNVRFANDSSANYPFDPTTRHPTCIATTMDSKDNQQFTAQQSQRDSWQENANSESFFLLPQSQTSPHEQMVNEDEDFLLRLPSTDASSSNAPTASTTNRRPLLFRGHTVDCSSGNRSSSNQDQDDLHSNNNHENNPSMPVSHGVSPYKASSCLALLYPPNNSTSGGGLSLANSAAILPEYDMDNNTGRLIDAIESLRDSIQDNTHVYSRGGRGGRPGGRRSAGGGISGTSSGQGGNGGSSGNVGQCSGGGLGHKPDNRLKVRKDKVAVEVRVVFLKIGEIDTLKELYHADVFIQAKWREGKLDNRTPEELNALDLDKYWSPMLYIDNILSESKDAQWLIAQANELGEVTMIERRRIKGVFLETLELNDFPLDVQDLTVTITTERPDTEIDLIPDQNEMSTINIQTFVDQQEWKLHEHVEITKRIMTQEYSSSMKSHPCLSVTCRAARRPGYFYWNVFLIMFMISGLSFATFAVTPDKAEYRLRLSFTLVLTSVTFKYVITQSLPKISYLTYMDKYVLMSLAILCIVSIWHALVTLIPDQYSSAASPSASPLAPPPTSNLMPNSPSAYALTDSISRIVGLAPASILPAKLPKTPKEALKSRESRRAPLYSSVDMSSQANRRMNMKASVANITSTLKKGSGGGGMVKIIERHVFISFCVLYILAHLIFIFWLYFDASKRRREMRDKDRDYREFLTRNREWQNTQKQREQLSNSRRMSSAIVHAI